MPTPTRPAGVSTTVGAPPGASVSDSLNATLPGMSMSKRCTFLCFASSAPSGPNTQHVLNSLPPPARSGTEPPTSVTRAAAAASESAENEGAPPVAAASKSSA